MLHHQSLSTMRVYCCVLCGLLLGPLWAATVYGQPEPSRLPRLDQPAPIRFGHLMPEDGLSQQTVNTILQDRNGFMWFGTINGLNRYDGYDFKIYRHDPADTTSLNARPIRSLLEDRTGRIWVGTGGAASTGWTLQRGRSHTFPPIPPACVHPLP